MEIYNRFSGDVIISVVDNKLVSVLQENRHNLTDANLRGANLTNADLGGADLTNANLTNANLGGADLRGADLTDANLEDANLRGANLTNADLGGADLRSANLTNADLTNANLRGANIDFTSWPLWCGSRNVKIDERIAMQLLAHAFNAAQEFCEPTQEQKDFMNGFHRIKSGDFPKF